MFQSSYNDHHQFFTGMDGLKPYLNSHVDFYCSSHEFQTAFIQLIKVVTKTSYVSFNNYYDKSYKMNLLFIT